MRKKRDTHTSSCRCDQVNVSFHISDLQLTNFRNYGDDTFGLDPSLTILHGANAVGKTNIVEAIQLLCEVSTFRKASNKDIIKHGGDTACITLTAHDGSRTRCVKACIEQHTKSYEVNGKKVSVTEGILGHIPIVVFTPDNLGLVKDSAVKRRSELDELGYQLSKNYVQLCREYTKAVKGRNRLLADGYFMDPSFEAWTDQLITIGAALYENRAKLLARLAPLICEHYQLIDPHASLEVTYITNWGALPEDTREESAEKLRLAFDESFSDECTRRITLVGPHRDDILFGIDGHDARTFASQGQQRTIALSWKLAHVSIIEEVLGVRPILLLDDVMSELDSERRDALMAQVEQGAQTIITTTNIGYFESELLDRARVIEIERNPSCDV